MRTIEKLLGRVRRRLRFQRSLEWVTTAAIPGVAAALVLLWLWRMELIATASARLALAGVVGLVLLAALVAALRRYPRALLASRLDRASGLANRLGTAIDFSARLPRETNLHPETEALMRAAIDDGLRAAARADVRAASPFRRPRDLRAFAAFAAVGAVISLLSFGPEPASPKLAAVPPPGAVPTPQSEALDPDDIAYQREIVEEMKRTAAESGDLALAELAKKLDALLDKAEKGEIGKQEMLAEMESLERSYQPGATESADAIMTQLKEQGKELKKQPPTQKLGEALEKGDLDAAQQEMDKLADQIEKGALKPEDQKKIADALDKATEKQKQLTQKRDQREDQQAQQKMDKMKQEIRRLQKKQQDDPKNEDVKRTIAKQQRELEKLEREQKDKQDQRQDRFLQRLSRNMEQAAENLKQKNQQQQQQSAQNMRRAADETRKQQQQMKGQQNQQKARSKLADLKDAIRRARSRPSSGQGQKMTARAQRLQDLQRRAGGQQGNSQAWKGGNSAEKLPWIGQQGGQQGGKQWGDEHDPNLTGDETKLDDAKFNEDQLEGKKGKGPSRRSTILTSARKGFSSVSYSKVYAEYQKVIEEVMSQEKVPQGYRYYVKRYFQRIRPQTD